VNNPNTALWLYVAIIFTQFLASPTWARVRSAITDATKIKAAQGATDNTQTSGTGPHTP